jgi:hypothetical protein
MPLFLLMCHMHHRVEKGGITMFWSLGIIRRCLQMSDADVAGQNKLGCAW